MRGIKAAIFSALLITGITVSFAEIGDIVHPDWDLQTIPFPEDYWTMGVGFLSDGKMVMAVTDFQGGGETTNPREGTRVLVADGVLGENPTGVTVTEITNMWRHIAGITVVDDVVYVSDRHAWWKIDDITDASEPGGNRTKIVDWPNEDTWSHGEQWHQWVFSPAYYDGFFYAPYSGSIRPGGPSNTAASTSWSGAALKWDVAGNLEKYAGGLRSPNGGNVGETGLFAIADNQGSWLPASTFAIIKPDRFYGHRQTDNPANWAEDLPEHLPTAWLPHGEVRKSPTEPIEIPHGVFKGDWLLGDINDPGLLRIFLDEVIDDNNEVDYNGSITWFTKGMGDDAINRLEFGPDEALYIGTHRNIAGNWPGGGARPFYKLVRQNDGDNFEVKAVRLLTDGFDIEFTQPVDATTVGAGNFAMTQYHYTRQQDYGQGKGTEINRTVTGTEVSTDGTRVHVMVTGLEEDMVTDFALGAIKSADGDDLFDTDIWYTLNYFTDRTWNPTTNTDFNLPAWHSEVQLNKIAGGNLELVHSFKGSFSASLIDLKGRVLQQVSNRSDGSIFTKPGSTGIYFVKVEHQNAVETFKVIF